MKRNQVDDLPRSDAPRTTATIEYIRAVNRALRLKEGASIRNVNAKLRQEEFKTSNTSVWRAKSSLKLKRWIQRKVQKLTIQQKQQRIIIAKRLRKKYVFKQGNQHYLRIDLLNTDFSGMIMLWGGISYQGLFPKQSPIITGEYLESIRPEGDNCCKNGS